MLASVSQIHKGKEDSRDMSAPMLPMADKETSLNILTNALTSGTGSTTQQKNEKASYGAIAEALRDEPAVRFAKFEVNSRSIPRIEDRIKRLRRSKNVYKIGEVIFGLLTIVLGVFTTSVSEVEQLRETFKGGYITGLHVLNLITGALLVFCAKAVSRTREDVRQMDRDLEKKIMYNSVAARTLGIVHYDHNSSTQSSSSVIYKPNGHTFMQSIRGDGKEKMYPINYV
uniref:NS3 n=1 Tax=Skunk River virus TaxID=2488682 RepID=A0A3Q8RRS3_9REOV|nr:NS3 [Skunk River virus]